MRYELIVGNIGKVHLCDSTREAFMLFWKYVAASKGNIGCATNEPVTLLRNGAIYEEYLPESEDNE